MSTHSTPAQSSNDRVALVTGGGSGIGRATVELFLRRGLRVVVVDRDDQSLAELAAHERLVTCTGDVTEVESNARAAATAIEHFGRIDHAILNVGMPMSGVIDGFDLDRYRHGMDVNLTSVVLGVQAVLPHFRAQRSGSFVLTASTAGMGGDPRRWAYSAAKAAVINLVHSLAIDFAPDGIRINAVCPGPVATGMTRSMRDTEPERYAAMSRLVPMQRFGEPTELANVIAFLASDEASFVTGAAVPVDGGGSSMSSNYRPEGWATS